LFSKVKKTKKVISIIDKTRQERREMGTSMR
jgi:hypothetical protein